MQQLSCFPTDGLAWAELGAVVASRGIWDDRTVRYLQLSQQYAPYEGEALAARLQLLAPLGQATNKDLQAVFDRDLSTALAFGSPTVAASTLSTLNAQKRAEADQRLANLDKARRDAIAHALQAIEAQSGN